MKSRIYAVDKSNYLIEVMPDESVLIWEVRCIKAELTEAEAHDWLMEELRPEHPCIPVTRAQ